MRVTILGMPGSGKSTLAKAISEKLNIPHIHIDRFWLEAGGRQNSRSTPNAEEVHRFVKEKVMEAIQTESWVSDGVYSRVQPEIAEKADSLVYLDIPLWRRLLNHANRLTNRTGRHKEVTFWSDVRFFLEMIRRDFGKTNKIDAFVEAYRDKTIILKSRKEIEKYLENLARVQ